MIIEIPEKLVPFMAQRARYKVAHGGRGGGKSWAFGRCLLAEGATSKQRILCTREIQKSIKDSVHKLLSDQIEAMGLSHHYEILDNEIRGKNGTEIIFAGLQQHTAASIKSYEGVTRCWIEEAQTISKKSLDILLPTIRAEGSEIWVGMNPLLDTDPSWQRFVENPHPDSLVVQLNWDDNPWFPGTLELERQHCLISAPADYENIWGGKCRPTVEGAIYANEMALALQEMRICPVPYDPRLKVHAIWDMGWNDAMTIILVQKGLSELRVIGYMEESFKTLDWWASELKKLPYNWGYDWLPHDAYHGDFKTGKTAAVILKSFGRKPKATPNIPVESGIRAARMTFPRCYFDKAKTARLVECLKRYKRAIPTTTGEPGAPVHDEFSHGADAFRYLGVVAEQLKNEDDFLPPPIQTYGVLDQGTGY